MVSKRRRYIFLFRPIYTNLAKRRKERKNEYMATEVALEDCQSD